MIRLTAIQSIMDGRQVSATQIFFFNEYVTAEQGNYQVTYTTVILGLSLNEGVHYLRTGTVSKFPSSTSLQLISVSKIKNFSKEQTLIRFKVLIRFYNRMGKT